MTLRNRKFLRPVDPVTIRDNVWRGQSTPPRRMTSDGDTVTVDPIPRVMPTSPGLVTPPRAARTSAGGRLADPEVTIVTEVGGDDESHDDYLSESMLSERPEVTVTETAGEASSGPRRGSRTRRQPSYLNDFEL